MLTLLIVVLGSPITQVLAAQENKFQRQLTGEAERRWVLVEFEVFMGADDKCLEGEDYTFFNDNTALVRQCLDGRIIETKRSWRLDLKDELDPLIRLGTEEFLLIFFYQDTNHLCLILRQRAKEKHIETQDRILCQEE